MADGPGVGAAGPDTIASPEGAEVGVTVFGDAGVTVVTGWAVGTTAWALTSARATTWVSTVAFAVVLAAVFSVWYATQRTLSVHRIDTRPREFFYWCAVLATFALGTAVGDLTATTFGLGYLASGILFGILFAVPGIAYRWWGLGATAAFWTSYVLTRPFGASISDWLAVSHARGGLDLGTGPVSLVLFAGIVVCVVLMSARRSRGQEAVAPEATAAS